MYLGPDNCIDITLVEESQCDVVGPGLTSACHCLDHQLIQRVLALLFVGLAILDQ